MLGIQARTESSELIDPQVFHPPLDVVPPVGTKQPRALGQVQLLRRERVLELLLLTHSSSVAMEGGTGKLVICLLQNLNRELAAVDPVMIVRDNPRGSKPVVVHQRPQRLSNIRLLSRTEDAGRVRGIRVFGLVLDANRIRGDALISEPL